MGIHGLMKLLSEECPAAIKQQEMESFTGRKIAIDASMAMYQFLVAVRSNGAGGAANSMMLTNEAGEVTSHIQGMFNRTIKMMTAGIKPVYVFDGKPPVMKSGELAKRIAKRAKAESDLAAAKEAGDQDDVDKFSRRLVKVTKQHNDDCKELLKLMGVPYLDAPCEAEAQCAELAKNGKVYAVATEDMDALTFRTPKLIRKLTFSQGKDKDPIVEIDSELVLSGLGLTYEQFVDLCILCGCDYCTSIKSIGPKTALKLIRQYKSIENIVSVLKKDKKITLTQDWFVQRVPKKTDNPSDTPQVEQSNEAEEEANESDVEENEDDAAEFLNNLEVVNNSATHDIADEPVNLEDSDEYEIIPPLYAQARELFVRADVMKADEVDIKWSEPDEAGIKAYLVDRMGFNAERVASGIKKLQEAQAKKAQKRLDSFFAPVSTTSSTLSAAGAKRKAEEAAASAKNKNKAAKGGGPRRH